MLHDEAVTRHHWLSDSQFLDLLGATNLIPGPNSTEMAIHVGYLRAGWPGLIVAGLCFIVPAMIMVLGLSWAYVHFNTAPQTQWILYGIKPVIVVVIIQALWMLGKKAIRSIRLLLLALFVLVLYLGGVNELVLLLAGGVTNLIIDQVQRRQTASLKGLFLLPAPGIFALSNITTPLSLLTLFFSFLKIGSILYGSGYVLLAFLNAEFVQQNGWLTNQQLIDAVAIGQLTPGPVFTTATFIGYLLAGFPGAAVATIGIFLPAFIFVAISNPFIPRLRESKTASSILDGVIVSSLVLMAVVTWNLGQAALIDPFTVALAVIAGVFLFKFRVNTTWLVLLGAVAGIIAAYFL